MATKVRHDEWKPAMGTRVQYTYRPTDEMHFSVDSEGNLTIEAMAWVGPILTDDALTKMENTLGSHKADILVDMLLDVISNEMIAGMLAKAKV